MNKTTFDAELAKAGLKIPKIGPGKAGMHAARDAIGSSQLRSVHAVQDAPPSARGKRSATDGSTGLTLASRTKAILGTHTLVLTDF